MSYLGQKIQVVILSLIALCIGIGFMLVCLLQAWQEGITEAASLGSWLGVAFGAIWFIAGIWSLRALREISKFQNQTFAWYRKTYPSLIKGNRAACHSCGNDRITLRSLMNRTYTRAHVCSSCGTTLYYSPE